MNGRQTPRVVKSLASATKRAAPQTTLLPHPRVPLRSFLRPWSMYMSTPGDAVEMARKRGPVGHAAMFLFWAIDAGTVWCLGWAGLREARPVGRPAGKAGLVTGLGISHYGCTVSS